MFQYVKPSPASSASVTETVAASLCSWWRPVRRLADSDPGRPASRVSYAILLGGAATVLYAAVVLSSQVSPSVRVAVDDVGSAVAALVASMLAFLAGWAQRPRRARASWLLIGLSLLWWGIGDLYWAWFEVVTGVSAVTPSLADVAYLLAAPLAFAGILLRPTLRRRAISRWLLLIDACLALAALFGISWVLIIGPAFAQHDVDPIVQAVTLAYPVADLGTLFCLLLAMLRASEHRPATGLLLVGLAAAAVADSAYAALVAADAYYTGHPVDVLWFVALVLMGLAAVVEHDDATSGTSLPGGNGRRAVALPGAYPPGGHRECRGLDRLTTTWHRSGRPGRVCPRHRLDAPDGARLPRVQDGRRRAPPRASAPHRSRKLLPPRAAAPTPA